MDKNRKRLRLKSSIVLIVLASMISLLLVQSLVVAYFLNQNQQRKQRYIDSMVGTLSASLDSLGANLESLGAYVSSYDAFQNLYMGGPQIADSVANAFHAVQFMTSYVPIVEDIIVVDTKGIPISYFAGLDYEVIDLLEGRYDFQDNTRIDKSYFFFPGKDYFAYVVPIYSIYATTTVYEKMATAVFLCDARYIEEQVAAGLEEHNMLYAVLDQEGQVIFTNGSGNAQAVEAVENGAIGSETLGLTIRAWGESTYQDEEYDFLVTYLALSVGIVLVLTVAMIFLMQRQVAEPVSDLVREMREQEKNSLSRRISPSRVEEINILVDGFNRLLDEVEQYARQIFHTQDKLYEMELRKNEAEIYALQSQINPHFLYNTLQCIRSIAILKGVDEIAGVSLAMSELYRYAIQHAEYVTLKEELDIIRKYVFITGIRFQGRFRFVFEVEESILAQKMIKMLIQPLVENAVFHGVSKREEGGTVWIRGSRSGDEIILSVTDDGPGIEEAVMENIRTVLAMDFSERLSGASGQCLGLYNIHRRVKLHYGEQYGLAVSREADLTRMELRLPVVDMREDHKSKAVRS